MSPGAPQQPSQGAGPRSRDLLPLPLLPSCESWVGPRKSRSVHKRIGRRSNWIQWANDGIRALNELSGHGKSFSGTRPNAAQEACVNDLSSVYRDFGPPPAEFSEEESLGEILRKAHFYAPEAGEVVPYQEGSVSFPTVGAPVDITAGLSDDGRMLIRDFGKHLLCSEGEASQKRLDLGIDRVYSDPSLVNDAARYGGFLRMLAEAGMIRWERAGSEGTTVGIFFVRKKDGRLRLIFDTRIVNTKFVRPARADVPSAGAFASIACESQPLYTASGDIDCAFYRLRVPDELGSYFRLPSVGAHWAGVSSIDGCPISPNQRLVPCLTVLPMGWNWAPFFCQNYLTEAICEAGVASADLVRDGVPITIAKESVKAAAYLDNYLVLGHNSQEVDRICDNISSVLQRRGIVVHELSRASTTNEFIGLQFGPVGVGSRVSIKSSRLWRLRGALSTVLRRGSISGKAMQILVGHITWAMLVRRESLSILSATYAYASQMGSVNGVLWPSVRRELGWVSALLPMMFTDLSRVWSPKVAFSDACPFGIGVVAGKVDGAVVKSVGEVSERWRFSVEAAVAARRHALSVAGLASADDPKADSKSVPAPAAGESWCAESVAGKAPGDGFTPKRGPQHDFERCVSETTVFVGPIAPAINTGLSESRYFQNPSREVPGHGGVASGDWEY